MLKLSDDLKRILSALAHQYDADYLTTHEKIKSLGIDTEAKGSINSNIPAPVKHKPAAKHIAIVCDGRGIDAPLDYAIETCSNHCNRLDILVHGAMDTTKITDMEHRIQHAGLSVQRIHLGAGGISHLIDYIRAQSSLLFLVASPNDSVAKELMDTIISKKSQQMNVPLVLIENRSTPILPAESAA